MAEVTVKIEGTGGGTFSLPLDSRAFVEAFEEYTARKARIVVRAFVAEFQRQIVKVIVPELKRRTPVRTGKMKRMTRTRQIAGGIEIRGVFYGAFISPSQREISQAIFRQRRGSIYRACWNAAHRALRAA